jgi:hypothetical protein
MENAANLVVKDLNYRWLKQIQEENGHIRSQLTYIAVVEHTAAVAIIIVYAVLLFCETKMDPEQGEIVPSH